MKTGLVLEGGGMRGLYTVGVLDALMENGLKCDYVVGVSAGACNGISYVSGQKGRGYRVDMNYLEDKRYLSFENFLRTKSLFGMDFIFDEIPISLDPFDYEAFRRTPTEFWAGVTDVETGRPAYFDKSHMMHGNTVLRASSSIPLFSPMVEYQGKLYLDGGTSDPIPLKKAVADGCDRLVVVLTQHWGYKKQPEKYKKLYHYLFRHHPEMAACLDRRHLIYNNALACVEKCVNAGTALLVAPKKPVGISRFEKSRDKLDALYRLGFSDASAMIKQIKSHWGKE